jgi:integrase
MTSNRPVKVTVSQVKRDPKRNLPYYVRWRVDGKQHWLSFPTKSGENGADIFHSKLVLAAGSDRSWDPKTGLPASMVLVGPEHVARLAQRFVQSQWGRLAPNTRRSYVEAMVALILAAIQPNSIPEPTGTRSKLNKWLRPMSFDDNDRAVWPDWQDLDEEVRLWLDAYGLRADQLDRPAYVRIDTAMRKRPSDGKPYAMTTQNRLINAAKKMLLDSADLGLIGKVDWPRRKIGARAKSETPAKRRLDDVYPTLEGLRLILRAMENHQPASFMYQALSAVCAYGGLRPGEAVALTVEDLDWDNKAGPQIRVERAWSGVAGERWNTGDEEIAGPKTERSYRTVMMPRPLRDYLEMWLRKSGITTGRIFVTREGTRPTQSNWIRALAKACEKTGWSPALTPYDLRRIHASHLVLYVPITEAAERLGHSVEVLTRNYLRRVEAFESRTGGWDTYISAVEVAFEDHLFDGKTQKEWGELGLSPLE